ncbi:MAG: hypothetical protein ACKOET_04750, partial [Verrucomicrobiota bacterium]
MNHSSALNNGRADGPDSLNAGHHPLGGGPNPQDVDWGHRPAADLPGSEPVAGVRLEIFFGLGRPSGPPVPPAVWGAFEQSLPA